MVLVHGDKGMGLFELFEGLIVLLCLGQAAFAQRIGGGNDNRPGN